jgi:hypothetical protein
LTDADPGHQQLMPHLTRLLGLATAGYGAAIIARPRLLARPCGLTGEHGRVPPTTALLVGAIGVRDLASGAAMVLAPPGRARQIAVGVRVLSDTGDALLFGTKLPDRDKRRFVAIFAIGFAALCAASTLLPDER